MNSIDLGGRNAVVTGGAQGIGRAIAERILRSGGAVMIWDRDAALAQATAAELNGIGRTESVAVDVSDFASVQEATEATRTAFGRIDCLVNNAGVAGMNVPTVDYPVEEWQKILRINLDGVFYCCKAVMPHMIAAGYGRVVNVASIAGKEGNPNASAYSASKAGVIALTKSLAKEVASHDIAVNCITPAAAKTAIFDQMSEEHIRYMLSRIPRGRFLLPEEVGSMVAWMLSAENTFTTGAVFDISGGRATY